MRVRTESRHPDEMPYGAMRLPLRQDVRCCGDAETYRSMTID